MAGNVLSSPKTVIGVLLGNGEISSGLGLGFLFGFGRGVGVEKIIISPICIGEGVSSCVEGLFV